MDNKKLLESIQADAEEELNKKIPEPRSDNEKRFQDCADAVREFADSVNGACICAVVAHGKHVRGTYMKGDGASMIHMMCNVIFDMSEKLDDKTPFDIVFDLMKCVAVLLKKHEEDVGNG